MRSASEREPSTQQPDMSVVWHDLECGAYDGRPAAVGASWRQRLTVRSSTSAAAPAASLSHLAAARPSGRRRRSRSRFRRQHSTNGPRVCRPKPWPPTRASSTSIERVRAGAGADAAPAAVRWRPSSGSSAWRCVAAASASRRAGRSRDSRAASSPAPDEGPPPLARRSRGRWLGLFEPAAGGRRRSTMS